MTDAATIEGAPAARHWGVLGTIGWGIGIAIAFVLIQSIAAMAYITKGQGGFTEEEVRVLTELAQRDGVAISIATLLTAVLCVPLIVGIAKLKRGARVGDYLAVRAVPLATLGRWLGITLLAAAASDALTWSLGRQIAPDFMKSVYVSADPKWLVWLALVAGAPLFEEFFFRGFLFKGLEASIQPIGATIVTAALWSAIHVQYDLYGIATLFAIGLLLGAARWRTGSIVVPLAMHAIFNFVACAEAAMAVRGLIGS